MRPPIIIRLWKGSELRIDWSVVVYVTAILTVLALYNLLAPPSLMVGVWFYILTFGWCIVAGALSVLKLLRSGPERGRRHAKTRHAGRLVGNLLLIVIGMYYGALVLDDCLAAESLRPRSVVIQTNLTNLYGHIVLQQVNFLDEATGVMLKGAYAGRADYLEPKRRYQIVCGPKSEFIYLAQRMKPAP